jgi:hypothetical protein
MDARYLNCNGTPDCGQTQVETLAGSLFDDYVHALRLDERLPCDTLYYHYEVVFPVFCAGIRRALDVAREASQ